MKRRNTRYIVGFSILAVVAAASFVFLLSDNRGGARASLPRLEPMSPESIERLRITHGDGESFELQRSPDGEWIVEPGAFRADIDLLRTMANAISSVRIVDTVSISQDVYPYGLDEGSRTTITALGRDGRTRTVHVGRGASVSGHVYVALEGDPHVYRADQDLRACPPRTWNDSCPFYRPLRPLRTWRNRRRTAMSSCASS